MDLETTCETNKDFFLAQDGESTHGIVEAKLFFSQGKKIPE